MELTRWPRAGVELAALGLSPRLRKDLWERTGLATPAVTAGSVWFHGASAGEVRAACALAAAVGGPSLVTSDTDTGALWARDWARQEAHWAGGARPLDHPATLAPLWADARPRAIVFVEATYWPSLAALAHQAGIPVIRASYRPGPGSQRLPFALSTRLWRHTTLVCAQSADAAQWIRRHSDTPVIVTGDIKSGLRAGVSPVRFSQPVVIGACTHAPEEEALLRARPEGWQLLLAPRYLSRLPDIIRQLDGHRWVRYSELGTNHVPSEIDVVLLDIMGPLGALTSAGTCVWLGGTLDPSRGGHSAQDAAVNGIPIICGPHTWATEGTLAMTKYVQISGLSQLSEAISKAQGQYYEPQVSPALEQTACVIRDQLAGPAPEASPRPFLPPLPRIRLPRRRIHPSRPTVVVGGQNARGGGKTTCARWVASQLARQGLRVGVQLSGHGRLKGQSLRTGRFVGAVGDEAMLFVRDGHRVCVGRDVGAAINYLQAMDIDVLVLEDGLSVPVSAQRLVEVIDARFPQARGPIPRGERRRVSRASGVETIRIAQHISQHFPAPLGCLTSMREYGTWHLGDQPQLNQSPPSGGIFCAGLGRLDVPTDGVCVHPLPDHWLPSSDRISWFRQLIDSWPAVVVTEKDLVKLPPAIARSVWWRPLHLRVQGVPDSFWRVHEC